MKYKIIVCILISFTTWSCNSQKNIKSNIEGKLILSIKNVEYSDSAFKLIAQCEIHNNTKIRKILPKPNKSNNKSKVFGDNYFTLKLNSDFICDAIFLDTEYNDRSADDFFVLAPGEKHVFSLDYQYSNGQDCYNKVNSNVEVSLVYNMNYADENRNDFLEYIVPKDLSNYDPMTFKRDFVLDFLKSDVYKVK